MEVECATALEAQRAAHPELGELIDDLQKYSSAKLYHQLTQTILQYIVSPPFAASAPKSASELLDFFNGFLKAFEKKFSKISWLQILAIVCKPQAPDLALDVIESAKDGVAGERDALFLWKTLKAEKLVLASRTDEAKDLLEAVGTEIDNAYEVDAVIQSEYHKANALLWKKLVKPQAFYKSSILYLAFTPIAAIPVEDRALLAYSIGVNALIADDVFDFGELLQQEVFGALDGSQYSWIKDLLLAFGEGKFDMYDAAFAKHRAQIDSSAELQGTEATLLRPKMSVLALMELAFRKPKKQRRLTFDEIAHHCRIDIKEVDHLVMKTMCAKLIQGKMDQVAALVMVTWVKPRILDTVRIDLMKERMDAWASQAGLLIEHVEEMTPELLVS